MLPHFVEAPNQPPIDYAISCVPSLTVGPHRSVVAADKLFRKRPIPINKPVLQNLAGPGTNWKNPWVQGILNHEEEHLISSLKRIAWMEGAPTLPKEMETLFKDLVYAWAPNRHQSTRDSHVLFLVLVRTLFILSSTEIVDSSLTHLLQGAWSRRRARRDP